MDHIKKGFYWSLGMLIKYSKVINSTIISLLLIMVFSSFWLSYRNGEVTTICDYRYIIHFTNNLSLKIFLASLISMFGIIISLLVLQDVRKDKIENIDDFLWHLINFLNNSLPSDEIVIMTPTFFFGGTSNNNKYANHYIRVFKNRFKKFKNLKIYALSLPDGFCENIDNYQKSKTQKATKESSRLKYKADYSMEVEEGDNKLVQFHKKLFESRNNKNDFDERFKYFSKLCDLYQYLNENSISIEDIPISLLQTNIILFLNITNDNGVGIIGVFDENKNFDLKGNFIESKQAVLALNELFGKHIGDVK